MTTRRAARPAQHEPELPGQTVTLAGRDPERLQHAAAEPVRCGLAGRSREKVCWW
jgi:hypothetical protein